MANDSAEPPFGHALSLRAVNVLSPCRHRKEPLIATLTSVNIVFDADQLLCLFMSFCLMHAPKTREFIL